ncbi:MAG: DNA polymerase III subunit epsilon [bacterium P3]|nr:MAG: DNA polymerase III subunit epsilon [bacterium P3]KWW32476.1 MAG: DNA polymerase III subunit epsilon [bacterium F083]
MQLKLTRPIVFFDLETTGVQVGTDRIVEICLHKVMPDQRSETLTLRVRPVDNAGQTLHIPADATAVHGISDADVADKPAFREVAPRLLDFIGDADLAGYNSNRFDVPMLVEEFIRAGIEFDVSCRHLVDVQNIFHKMEQRTLKAAYRFYCGKELDGAHSADADTLATYEVLLAQLDRYAGADYTAPDGSVSRPVVNDIAALSQFSAGGNWADLSGHIGYDAQRRETFNFGKYKGRTLAEIFQREPSYYDWMMKAEFPHATKQVVQRVYQKLQQQKLQQLKEKFAN